MSSAAIGYKVKNNDTGEVGTVQTYYENGDLVVRLPSGEFVRWADEDVLSLGRYR